MKSLVLSLATLLSVSKIGTTSASRMRYPQCGQDACGAVVLESCQRAEHMAECSSFLGTTTIQPAPVTSTRVFTPTSKVLHATGTTDLTEDVSGPTSTTTTSTTDIERVTSTTRTETDAASVPGSTISVTTGTTTLLSSKTITTTITTLATVTTTSTITQTSLSSTSTIVTVVGMKRSALEAKRDLFGTTTSKTTPPSTTTSKTSPKSTVSKQSALTTTGKTLAAPSTGLPAWAGPCRNSQCFSSACSCAGATQATVTCTASTVYITSTAANPVSGFEVTSTVTRVETLTRTATTVVTAMVTVGAETTTTSTTTFPVTSHIQATSKTTSTSISTSISTSSTIVTSSATTVISSITVSTCTATSTPVASPTCSSLSSNGVTYTLVYAGTKTLEPNNSGNDDRNFPPMNTTFAGTLDVCTAAQYCVNYAFGSFGKAYFTTNLQHDVCAGVYNCVAYLDPAQSSQYNVDTPGVTGSYGWISYP